MRRAPSILLACLLAAGTTVARAQEPEVEPDHAAADEASDDAEPAVTEADDTAPPPKIAVVVVGDPDDVLRAEALRVEEALARSDAVTVPADPDLRRALRGGPAAEEDDGLGRVRRERRQLGLGEDDDIPVLATLGRMAGAVAIVAVRRRGATIEAVILDVDRRSFFEGELDAGMATDEEVTRFVRSRALAARRAAQEAQEEGAPARAEVDDTGDSDADRPATGPISPPDDDSGPSDDEEDDGGIFDEWPLIVAGALLVGAILLFTLGDDAPAEPGPPVLRFVPGGR